MQQTWKNENACKIKVIKLQLFCYLGVDRKIILKMISEIGYGDVDWFQVVQDRVQ
jgi:hypothetical protein